MRQFNISLYHVIVVAVLFCTSLYCCYSYSYEMGLNKHIQVETSQRYNEGYKKGRDETEISLNEKCNIRIGSLIEKNDNVVKALGDYYKAREQSLNQTLEQYKLEIKQKQDLISSLRTKLSPNSDSWFSPKNIITALICTTIGQFWQLIFGWIGQLFTWVLNLWKRRDEYV